VLTEVSGDEIKAAQVLGVHLSTPYFAPSHLHFLILLVIILIIFGPTKLGDVGGALGRAIRDFKGAMDKPDGPKTVNKKVAPSRYPTDPSGFQPSVAIFYQ
jgi:TatA/E family protein of Tat protein translocase